MEGLNRQSDRPEILDQLSVLGDLTRTRLLLLLENQELTVAELCSVLQSPQSTVSRHLKALADGGWAVSRAEGTSRLYRVARSGIDADSRRLWQLVRSQVSGTSVALQDERRLGGVLAERRSRSQQFFRSAAGQWDRVRSELFSETFHFHTMLGLVDSDWRVADLGCGTGHAAEALAPHVREVIGVDESAAMLRAARQRLAGFDNVDLRRGSLESLPIDDASVDAALCMLVLHHLPDPTAAIVEAARVLLPGGRLLVAEMLPHDREAYRQEMGHVWLGFSEQQMRASFEDAGLKVTHARALSPDPKAQGPALFVISGEKNSGSSKGRKNKRNAKETR